MDATCYNYCSPNCDFFWSWTEIGDDCHFAIVSCYCFTYYGFSYPVFWFRLAESLEKFGAIWVCVWVAMCKIYLVIVIWELDLESECVVESSRLLFQWVLEITNILTVSVPTDSLALTWFSIFLWIYQWFHSLVIWALWLHQVHDVEFISGVFSSVVYFEIIPLGVSGGVVIVFEN